MVAFMVRTCAIVLILAWTGLLRWVVMVLLSLSVCLRVYDCRVGWLFAWALWWCTLCCLWCVLVGRTYGLVLLQGLHIVTICMQFAVNVISLRHALLLLVIWVHVLLFNHPHNFSPFSAHFQPWILIIAWKHVCRLELIGSILIAETHVFLILLFVNLVHFFSHDLAVPLCVFFSFVTIHYAVFKINTIFDHKSNNFLQTINHELGLSVFFITLPVAISTVELIDFMMKFFLQIIELKAEIVDYLCDLLFGRVWMTWLSQTDFVGSFHSGLSNYLGVDVGLLQVILILVIG